MIGLTHGDEPFNEILKRRTKQGARGEGEAGGRRGILLDLGVTWA